MLNYKEVKVIKINFVAQINVIKNRLCCMCILEFILFYLFIRNLETKYNAKAMSTYRHHSTYKSGI